MHQCSTGILASKIHKDVENRRGVKIISNIRWHECEPFGLNMDCCQLLVDFYKMPGPPSPVASTGARGDRWGLQWSHSSPENLTEDVIL